MKTALLFVSLIFFTAYSFSQIRFVSKTGNSTPPYTSWATASDSIQKCINICNDGDTVVVANGTYRESLVINSAITMLGSSIDSCIIDGRRLANLTIKPNKTFAIENFHVIGKADEPLTGVIEAFSNFVSCNNLWVENAYEGIGASRGATIKNCLFYNLQACISTSSAYNIDTFYISNNILLNNKSDGAGISNGGGGIHYIYNNIMLGLVHSTFTGINLSLDNYSEVKNNLVANYLFGNYDGSRYLNGAVIENNVFIQNNNDYIGNYNIAVLGGDKTIIKNNIIAYAKRAGIQAVEDTAFVDYNLFFGNVTNVNSWIKLGVNNVFTNPMFRKDTIPTEEMNFDYHLLKFSPAIDAGDPNILDKDGSRSDIGMFGGPLSESFSLLSVDLPPRTPPVFGYWFDPNTQIIQFSWDMNTENDFDHYNVYKDTITGFVPSLNNKLLEIDTSYFEEQAPQKVGKYFYKVTSVDKRNNESLPAYEVTITITDIDDPMDNTIREYELDQNYPNPFNASTIIGYTLKESGFVKLTVYDIKGERIAVLENGIKEGGYHEVVFDAGKLASGIYICRMEVTGNDHIPKYSDMKKLILLK